MKTCLHDRKRKREEEENGKLKKAREELISKIEKVVSARDRNGNEKENGFQSWNLKELQSYLQYKKIPSDTAMPKKVGELRARCLEVMGRSSPTVTPCASDDEDEGEGEALDLEVMEMDITGLELSEAV